MGNQTSFQRVVLESKLPATFKSTLMAMGFFADADKGYSNIWPSKATMGKLAGRSDKVMRRDCIDMEHFGIVIVWGTHRSGAKKYRPVFPAIMSWTDEHTERYKERRRGHQSKKRKPQHERIQELEAELATACADRAAAQQANRQLVNLVDEFAMLHSEETVQELIERAFDDAAHSPVRESTTPVLDRCTTPVLAPRFSLADPPTERTVAESGQAVENAGASKAAPVAGSSAGSARPDAVLLAMEGPSTRRHKGDLALSRAAAVLAGVTGNSPLCKLEPEEPDEKRADEGEVDPPASGRFRLLTSFGHRWMAKRNNAFEWSELREALRSHLIALGFPLDVGLISKVEDSLVSQHAHFLRSQTGLPAAPLDESPVRGA